jgi:hypothetical protein
MSKNDITTMPLTMSSLEISGLTGKRHTHVLRDARKMLIELGVEPAQFWAGYKDAKGEVRESFNLPKRECLILVSGYSTELRARIIDRWMQLEQAMAGDGEGFVTKLDRTVMNDLGGMIKGILHKQLANVVPDMVEAEIAKRQVAVIHAVTAGEVIVMAGVADRKGLKGLASVISKHLQKYHAAHAVAVKIATLGTRSAYAFDPALCRQWLSDQGKDFILKRIAERRGQGVLKLIQPKADEAPKGA